MPSEYWETNRNLDAHFFLLSTNTFGLLSAQILVSFKTLPLPN
jgi:hypothetical protein